MRKINKAILWTMLLYIILGAVIVLAGQWTLHKTSSIEFRLSCHMMQAPYEEYTDSVHFQGQEDICAECADCHIPEGGLDFLVAKLRTSEGAYHQLITKKVDTPEKFEEHRLEMMQTVWTQLKANGSATCRSCHSMDSVDLAAQSVDAQEMHKMGIAEKQTCIDCHKGVAHFLPEIKIDDSTLKGLETQPASTPASTAGLCAVSNTALGDLGTVYPATKMQILKTTDNARPVEIHDSQTQGSEQVIYYIAGQRLILVSLSEKGQQSLKILSDRRKDDYGNVWRGVVLQGGWSGSAFTNRESVQDYACKLDNVCYAGCHAPISANHFTLNAWPSVAEGMGARTNINEVELDILSRYFQYDAKDMSK